MGSRVIILDDRTISKIAAGEVIERPSSIVKELIENSIDAQSKRIEIEIKNGGKDYIRVSDNGIGMSPEDAKLAFNRHATSKIRQMNDLFTVKTLGFRGEALPSIASISEIELITKRREDLLGTRIRVSNNKIESVEETGCPDGTTVIVRNLFDNVPVRKKFLKKDLYESGYVSDVTTRIALINPFINFKLINDGKTVFNTHGNNDLLNTIICVYGKDIAVNLTKVDIRDEKYLLTGYISNPQLTRSNRNYQTFSINNRFIKDNILPNAVEDSYKTLLPVNRHPLAVLNFNLPGEEVDINVHPSKMEIRFNKEKEVYNFINKGISKLLKETINIPKIVNDVEKKDASSMNEQLMISEEKSIIDNVLEYKPKFSEKIEESVSFYDNDTIVSSNYIEDKNQNRLVTLIPLCQLFSTYILAQSNDEFFIIDQHAAHERILYEDLTEKYENKVIYKQELISPLIFDLTHKEKNIIIDNIDLINKLGFDIEDFGHHTIIVRTVPYTFKNEINKQLFIDIADELESLGSYKDEKRKDLIVMISCKSAIKANDKLTETEILTLLKKLEQTKYPYTCPHGRPTIISMSLFELEKRFKRR